MEFLDDMEPVEIVRMVVSFFIILIVGIFVQYFFRVFELPDNINKIIDVFAKVTIKISIILIVLIFIYSILNVLHKFYQMYQLKKDMKYIEMYLSEEQYEEDLEGKQIDFMERLYLTRRPLFAKEISEFFTGSRFFKGQIHFDDIKIKRKNESGNYEYKMIFGFPKQRETQVISALVSAYENVTIKPVEAEEIGMKNHKFVYELFTEKPFSFMRDFSEKSSFFINTLFDASMNDEVTIRTIFVPVSDSKFEKRVNKEYKKIREIQRKERQKNKDVGLMQNEDSYLKPKDLTHKKDLQQRRETKKGRDFIFKTNIIISGTTKDKVKNVNNKFVQATSKNNTFKVKRLRLGYKKNQVQKVPDIMFPQIHESYITGSELSTIIRQPNVGGH